MTGLLMFFIIRIILGHHNIVANINVIYYIELLYNFVTDLQQFNINIIYIIELIIIYYTKQTANCY